MMMKRLIRIGLIAGVSLLVGGVIVYGTRSRGDKPVLPDHPRLFFTAQDVPTLRQQAATTHAEIWSPVYEFAQSRLGTMPPSAAPVDGSEDTYRNAGNELIALAFACVITDAADYCDLATSYLLTYATWTQWSDNNMRDLALAHMLMGNALAYDWLYAYLTPDERTRVAASLVNWTEQMYEASSQPVQELWNNWWHMSYLQNHYWINNSALGIAGLALWDEVDHLDETCVVQSTQTVNVRTGPGTDFPVSRVLEPAELVRVWAEGATGTDGYTWWHTLANEWVRSDVVSELVDCTTARLWVNQASNRMALIQDFLNGIGDGSWHEGIAYQSYGLTLALPFWVNLRRLLDVDLFPHDYLSQYALWRVYNYLPGTIDPVLAFADFERDWGNSFAPQNVLRFAAAEYQDGYAEWMADFLIDTAGRYANVWNAPWYVLEFLYYDPDIVPYAPDDLALTRTFPDLEATIWRSGWGADALVFGLHSGAYGGRFGFNTFVHETYPWEVPCSRTECQLNVGHDHDDTNTFYLYRDGQWLIPETIGVGRSATSAHNTLLVDGDGQDRPSAAHWWRETEDFAGSDAVLETVITGTYFDYARADATQRYAHLGRIDDITRQVMFVRPDYFVMLDNVAAGAPHQITWVSHLGGPATVDDRWIQSGLPDGQLLGIYVAAPETFEVITGDDGTPYVHVQTASPVEDTRLIHVIYPTTEAAWATRPTITLLTDSGAGVALQVEVSDRTDDVLITYDRAADTQALGPYEFDGQAAAITRGAEGAIDRLFLIDGTFLQDSMLGDLVRLSDPAEQLEVSFSDQRVTVCCHLRGNVTLYAPGIEELIVDGSRQPFTRIGDTIEFGD